MGQHLPTRAAIACSPWLVWLGKMTSMRRISLRRSRWTLLRMDQITEQTSVLIPRLPCNAMHAPRRLIRAQALMGSPGKRNRSLPGAGGLMTSTELGKDLSAAIRGHIRANFARRCNFTATNGSTSFPIPGAGSSPPCEPSAPIGPGLCKCLDVPFREQARSETGSAHWS